MLVIASKIVACLVIAAIIGFLMGFLIGRGTRSKNNHINPIINPKHKAQGNVYDRPTIFSSPRPSGKDDLTKIDGLTKEIENELNQLGIFHFDQISHWSSKNCKWIEEYLEIENIINEQNWIKQAQDLSKMI